MGIFCLYKTLPVPNGGALVVNGPRQYSLPEPPRAAAGVHLQPHRVRAAAEPGAARRGGGPGLRGLVRAVGHGTVKAASIERVATGTQHFDRRHVDLGMSPLTKRIALAQDLEAIVEARRRNYFFLLGPAARRVAAAVQPAAAGRVPALLPDGGAGQGGGAGAAARAGHRRHRLLEALPPGVRRRRRSPRWRSCGGRILEIPCHQDLTPEVMAEVAAAVREALKAERRTQQARGVSGMGLALGRRHGARGSAPGKAEVTR